MAGTISVTVRPHWVNGWFLRLAARPFIRVDGDERAADWGQPVVLQVEPGGHEVAAGIRYKGFESLIGTAPRTVEVRAGEAVALMARNGALNSTPFIFRSGGRSRTSR